MKNAVEQLERNIIRIRSCIDNVEPEDEEELARKSTASTGDARSIVTKKVCSNITT